jgi:hypothetical protein
VVDRIKRGLATVKEVAQELKVKEAEVESWIANRSEMESKLGAKRRRAEEV